MEGVACGHAGCWVEIERLLYDREGGASRRILEERGLGGGNGKGGGGDR